MLNFLAGNPVISRIYACTEAVDNGYRDGNPDHNCCYMWTGATSGKPNGTRNGRGHSYPRMSKGSATVAVHREVWKEGKGPIPKSRQVDHKCHVRKCVRLEHLRLATQKANCLYRDRKNGVKRRRK